jgi:hypothetical protein
MGSIAGAVIAGIGGLIKAVVAALIEDKVVHA